MLFFIDILEEWELVEGHGRIKHRENHKKLHREHLIGCQGVNFLGFVKLSFFSFVQILVLSQFECLRFVTFFYILSQFEFLRMVTI